jgi:hypothetical protein
MNALRQVNGEEMAAHHAGAVAAGVRQANAMAGIAFENRRRVIEAFSEPGQPNDTGRTKVQGAYLPLVFALRFNCPFWRGSMPYPLVSVACRRNSI